MSDDDAKKTNDKKPSVITEVPKSGVLVVPILVRITATSGGPANVASTAYRTGWDAIDWTVKGGQA